MIDLSNFTLDDPSTEYEEKGSLNSFLKTSLDVDTNDIKKSWDDAINNDNVGGFLSTMDKSVSSANRNVDAINKIAGRHRVDTRSIIARARNSVLQFPIYVPQTIRVNEAHIIAKMFERVYATFVQAVLAQNPIMSEEEANNLVFLKKFHSNIKEAADVLTNIYYQPIDEIDRMMQESVFYEQKLTENCTVRFNVVPTDDQRLIQENARLMNEPLTGLNYLAEGAEKTETQTTETSQSSSEYVKIPESDLREMAIDKAELSSDEKQLIGKSAKEIENEINAALKGSDQDEIDRQVKMRLLEKEKCLNKVEDELKEIKADAKLPVGDPKKKNKGIEYKNGMYVKSQARGSKTKTTVIKTSPDQIHTDKGIDAPKLLKDSDIKKQNGLVPYTIEATFLIKDGSGNRREVRYIIGIKSTMHLFRPQDLAEDLHDLVQGKSKTLRKVKYKTGEISFLDYFLNIKGLKSDAAKHINYNKRWINTLKRLSDYKDMNGALMKGSVSAITGGQVPIPNGTLILSQPDVVTLTNETGIDLSVVSNAKKLAKNLFLIAVVIVDSSAGTMRVLFTDVDNEWDVQSLASIDAELSKTDNSNLMKELNKMVNK